MQCMICEILSPGVRKSELVENSGKNKVNRLAVFFEPGLNASTMTSNRT